MKIFILLILVCFLQAEGFKSAALISLEGQNKNFDFERIWNFETQRDEVLICFENYNDGDYSIYLKQIEPYSENNIIISSDSSPKINPSISKIPGDSVRIIWQQQVDGKWQLFSRTIADDSLTPVIQLTNSIEDNTDPLIYENHLIWINDLYLTFAEVRDSLVNIKKVDGSDCSNPDINGESLTVIYEQKVDSVNNIIKRARFIPTENRWELRKIVKSGNNMNPRFAYESGIYSYQKADTVWKSFIVDGDNPIWNSSNHEYNIENPYYFYYPTTIKSIKNFFVIYESDSIENNREIFLEFVPDIVKSKINISKMVGNDIKSAVIQINDSIAIVWEHIVDGGSQIYWAKDKFKHYTNIAEEKDFGITNFSLSQNYPNPFNPGTTIEYFIPKSTEISIAIYDLLGKKIRTIVSGKTQVGNNKIVWNGMNENGQNVGSGIYIYVLEYGGHRLSKKMILLR